MKKDIDKDHVTKILATPSLCNYMVYYMPHYPEDKKHLEICLGFGTKIRLGADIIYFTNSKRKESKTDKGHWWVMTDHKCISIPKRFNTADAAVDYARKQYAKWCKKELAKTVEDIVEANKLRAEATEIN